jgi:hypothetical protein
VEVIGCYSPTVVLTGLQSISRAIGPAWERAQAGQAFTLDDLAAVHHAAVALLSGHSWDFECQMILRRAIELTERKPSQRSLSAPDLSLLVGLLDRAIAGEATAAVSPGPPAVGPGHDENSKTAPAKALEQLEADAERAERNYTAAIESAKSRNYTNPYLHGDPVASSHVQMARRDEARHEVELAKHELDEARKRVERYRRGLGTGTHSDATRQERVPSFRQHGTDTLSATMLASVVVVAIEGVAGMDGPTAHAAMEGLHNVLRDWLASPVATVGMRVLSCLTGAIILVPDAANVELVELLSGILPDIGRAGVTVRVGIAHGLVDLLEDADDSVNAIGIPINVAARLAHAKENGGLLVHETYATAIASAVVPSGHWLHPSTRSGVEIAGKRTEKFHCFAAPPDALPTETENLTAKAANPRSGFVNAVMLAYDLPSFSDGDQRELASRFRSVVQEVRRLRQTGAIPADAPLWFSPGGDGAVLVINNVDAGLAHVVAHMLERLLEVETTLKAPRAGVRARIGLHYGPVFLYQSAEGPLRPTGPSLFIADALAGDDEARKYSTAIVSAQLIGAATYGSDAYQRDHFHEINPLAWHHRNSIQRFVRRNSHNRPPMPEGWMAADDSEADEPQAPGHMADNAPPSGAIADELSRVIGELAGSPQQRIDVELSPPVRFWITGQGRYDPTPTVRLATHACTANELELHVYNVGVRVPHALVAAAWRTSDRKLGLRLKVTVEATDEGKVVFNESARG